MNFTTIVYSEIAVYNSEAQAQAVAGTMGSAQWMQTCDEPSNLATAQSDATQTDGNMPCNLTIVNHNEAALATTGLPGGTGGWLFDSTVHCGVNNQDWSANTATIVTHRGRVVIALFAKAVENPQPPGQATPFNIDGPVAGAMTAVVGRAEAAQR
ncbi:MAG: hypothetical protein JST73_01875 [Actinobacteria bacterium]|nr:hypothetical protein [Actinomycetota bacterium]